MSQDGYLAYEQVLLPLLAGLNRTLVTTGNTEGVYDWSFSIGDDGVQDRVEGHVEHSRGDAVEEAAEVVPFEDDDLPTVRIGSVLSQLPELGEPGIVDERRTHEGSGALPTSIRALLNLAPAVTRLVHSCLPHLRGESSGGDR